MKKIFLILIPCFIFSTNIEKVKQALKEEFINNYPKIIINNIDLKSSSLPKDFDKFEFLRIANGRFDKAQGFLRAEFKTNNNLQKNVFFRYFIYANLEVLKSQIDIKKGQRLGVFDYEIVLIDFEKAPLNPVSKEDALNLIAKSNINKNTILKESMFKSNTLIKRKDIVVGILSDNGIDILVELMALDSGNLGQRIRLKNKDGKIMQGIITGKNRVKLQ